MTQLTRLQKFVADRYEGGEFSHIETVQEAREVGDTLFLFLVLEAGESDDDVEEFNRMLDTALRQTEDLRRDLDHAVLSGSLE